MYVGGAEQVAGHEDVPRGAVLHEARQLRGQCDESSSHPAVAASAPGIIVILSTEYSSSVHLDPHYGKPPGSASRR